MDCWCTARIDNGLLVHCQHLLWAVGVGALFRFDYGFGGGLWAAGALLERFFYLLHCQKRYKPHQEGRGSVSLHCSKETLEEKRLARALVYTVLKGYWKRRGWLGH